MKPSQQWLKEAFDYNPETGTLTRIGHARVDFIGQIITGRDIKIDGRTYVVSHIIWAWWYGYWTVELIDHRDGDNSNNRISNLREATHQQNQFNKVPVGQYPKGVVFKADAKRSKPWSARIRIDGKKVAIGSYATMEEAAAAYRKKAEEVQGKFAYHLSMTSCPR